MANRSKSDSSGLGAFVFALCIWALVLAAPLFARGSRIPIGEVRLGCFGGFLLGMVITFGVTGWWVKRRVLGVIIDNRNMYSLSRLQMVLWTIIAISALMAAAVSRAYGLDTDPANHGVSVATALNIDIPGELFAAMGISYFSGVAAPSLLALKSQSDSTPDQVSSASARFNGPLVAVGQVAARPSWARPAFNDLVQGDDLAGAGTADLSKVQQLIITIILVVSYVAMVGGFLLSDAFVQKTAAGYVTALPAFTPHIITLMALSHGGYLAYKAAQKAPTPNNPPVPARPTPPNPSATSA